VFICSYVMHAFTLLNVLICEILDKFQLFLFMFLCKECILSARSALTESSSTYKLRRDNMNLSFARSAKCPQGVR
jgi:hypothetical protein